VEAYLRGKLASDDWKRCFNQKPKEKILTLVELIEAAKKQKQTVK